MRLRPATANREVTNFSWLPFGACAICIGLLSPVFGWSQSQNASVSQLTAIFDSYAQPNEFSGTVLVAANGQTLLERSYGSANLDWTIPVTSDTKFRIGSLTKQFTAVLILLLQQDGRLHLSDPITTFITGAPEAWRQITVANLLGQTSGIPEFMTGPDAAAWSMSARSHSDIVAYIERNPVEFSPGARYAYSNSNYEILGAIIEKVTGRQYADVLNERLLKPLGLIDTGLDADELILVKRAEGYRRLGADLVRARPGSMSVAWAAGGMYSTLHDLSKWERALYEGTVLSDANLTLMTSAGQGSYGLGIEVSRVAGNTVLRHGGSIDGFNSFMSYIPAKHVSVVVLSNMEGTTAAAMGAQMDDAILGVPVTLINDHRAVPIRPEELVRFVGTYRFSPSFSLVFSVSGDHLVATSPGDPPLPLVYEGLRNGHSFFFVKQVVAELEFIPGEGGSKGSVVLHQAGHDEIGRLE